MFSLNTKSIFQSKTVITALVTALFGVAAVFGFTPPVGADPAAVLGAITAVGGVLAAIFRVNATQAVTVSGE